MKSQRRNSFKQILILVLIVPLTGAVSVNPALCPTNKIAPHRRPSRSWDVGYQRRTLGAFHDLLAPGHGGTNHGYDPSLQEEPQRDDPDDCGDIDDYDEHDLSALTPNYQRGDDYRYGDSRFFFGIFNRPQNSPNRPQQPLFPQNGPQLPQYPQNGPQRPQYPQNGPQQPQYPQNRPQQPQYPPNQPQRPVRPPYSTGGFFENNSYRPPVLHYPSDDIKPVHDGIEEPQTTYRPQMVGGQLGHIIGVSPVSVQYRPRPTRRPFYPRPTYDQQQPDYKTTPRYQRYPQPTTQPPYTYTTRRSRPRQLNNNNESILGSFFDLLF